jgi:hypothetical protein
MTDWDLRTWLQRNAIEHAVADFPAVTEVENLGL